MTENKPPMLFAGFHNQDQSALDWYDATDTTLSGFHGLGRTDHSACEYERLCLADATMRMRLTKPRPWLGD